MFFGQLMIFHQPWWGFHGPISLPIWPNAWFLWWAEPLILGLKGLMAWNLLDKTFVSNNPYEGPILWWVNVEKRLTGFYGWVEFLSRNSPSNTSQEVQQISRILGIHHTFHSRFFDAWTQKSMRICVCFPGDQNPMMEIMFKKKALTVSTKPKGYDADCLPNHPFLLSCHGTNCFWHLGILEKGQISH